MDDKSKENLKQRIDEVTYYLWDPIGVNDIPDARDEYSSYADHVWRMVLDNKTQSDISTYLTEVITDRMGLESTTNHGFVAETILSWKQYYQKS